MSTASVSPVFPCWPRFAVLAALLAAAFLLPAVALEWSRAGLAGGEYWRLATGHWVHLSVNHLLLNLGGLLVTALLFARHPPLIWWWWFLMLSPVVISAGLLAVPELAWYRGFSGCLHGLLVFTALFNIRSDRRCSVIVLGVVAVKLAVEAVVYPGAAENGLIGGQVITQSHWLGALTGVAAGILLRVSDWLRHTVRE